MKKINHDQDQDRQDAPDRHHQSDHAQDPDHDQRRDLAHVQNAKNHVIEAGHVTREGQEASLQVKVAAEADHERQKRNLEDRDHDLDPKSI